MKCLVNLSMTYPCNHLKGFDEMYSRYTFANTENDDKCLPLCILPKTSSATFFCSVTKRLNFVVWGHYLLRMACFSCKSQVPFKHCYKSINSFISLKTKKSLNFWACVTWAFSIFIRKKLNVEVQATRVTFLKLKMATKDGRTNGTRKLLVSAPTLLEHSLVNNSAVGGETKRNLMKFKGTFQLTCELWGNKSSIKITPTVWTYTQDN